MVLKFIVDGLSSIPGVGKTFDTTHLTALISIGNLINNERNTVTTTYVAVKDLESMNFHTLVSSSGGRRSARI